MRKFHITDNLGDLGGRVCTEEIRLLLGVAPLLLPGLAEDGQERDLSVSEVKTIEGGSVRQSIDSTSGRPRPVHS